MLYSILSRDSGTTWPDSGDGVLGYDAPVRNLRKGVTTMKHKKSGGAAVLSAPAAGAAGGSVSTMQAARMCGVSTFSVHRWFDPGMLPGTNLPGGRRRLSAASLARVMEEPI